MAHDPAHEDLLLQLSAGDRSPDEPAVRAMLAGCAECGSRWLSLHALTTGIDAGERERREILAAVAAAVEPTDAARVRAVLDSERAKTFGRPPSRILASGRLLLVAVTLLVVGLIARRVMWPSPPVRPDLPLSTPTTKIEFLAPFAILRAQEAIGWRYPDLPSGGAFRVTIEGSFANGRIYSHRILTPTAAWTPTADLLNAMPDRVFVRVMALDASQNLAASSPELELSVTR